MLIPDAAALLRKDPPPPLEFYDAAIWINRNLPKSAVVGAFQSGILGYYLEREFYGLDGKINADALEALRGGRIDAYMQERGIGYLADWRWVIGSCPSTAPLWRRPGRPTPS